MPSDPEDIWASIVPLLDPGARGRLIAKGLARGIVWRDGQLPSGASRFAPQLSAQLLDFGYGLLAAGLELRDSGYVPQENDASVSQVLRVASEAIESASRRSESSDSMRGFNLLVASTALHIAGYAARSFSLMPPNLTDSLNLSHCETLLGLLLRRDFSELRRRLAQFFAGNVSDAVVARKLADADDDFSVDDAVNLSFDAQYSTAVGFADSALYTGDQEFLSEALRILQRMCDQSGDYGLVPVWWVATLTRHLLVDLWQNSLHERLPPAITGSTEEVQKWAQMRDDYISSLAVRVPPQLDLWPSQLDAAARSIDPADDLVVSLPTSAGKTRIAELCILRTLAAGRRAIYVTPLRSLSAQVEKSLGRVLAPVGATVTSLYGASGVTLADTNTLRSAKVVVATPEKLDFAMRQDPHVLNDVGLVVFDEGHMIGLSPREIRYEVLVQRLLRRSDSSDRRIVCLSAMFKTSDDSFRDFCQWLRADKPGEPVYVAWRPTRERRAVLKWSASSGEGKLQFLDGEKPFVERFVASQDPVGKRTTHFPKDDKELIVATTDVFAQDGQSVLVYCPQRSLVDAQVRTFVDSRSYLKNIQVPDASNLELALAVGREWLGEKHAAVKSLQLGIGGHHAGLPRPFLTQIEELLDEGIIQVVVASPTLAQGIDLKCATLIFRTITRFDEKDGKQKTIPTAEFVNVMGRAGRAYVDLEGTVVFPFFKRATAGEKEVRKLLEHASPQVLWSGLVRLVHQISEAISQKLGVNQADFLEYVLNHSGMWSESDMGAWVHDVRGDETEEQSLAGYISDLDVALFSLVEQLDVSVDDLAAQLDEVLRGSLWERTISRIDAKQKRIIDAVLKSRAEWLWRNADIRQRRAFFDSGLGQQPGSFLYDRLDALVASLKHLSEAVVERSIEKIAAAAVAFSSVVFQSRFFSPRTLVDDWMDILCSWVSGVAFSDMLTGRASLRTKSQAFIQDTVIFHLVWAVEAVRVQGRVAAHPDVDGIGDTPALVLTYGVPSVEAALLCRAGFSSRVGAHWATEKLDASFSSVEGLREWIVENQRVLGDPTFWPNRDVYTMWSSMPEINFSQNERTWRRRRVKVPVQWLDVHASRHGNRVRIVQTAEDKCVVCGMDLRPLGEVLQVIGGLTPTAYLVGEIVGENEVELEIFGPRMRGRD